MNALTAVHNNAVDSGQDYSGFTLIPSAQSPRLLELTFTEQTTKQFLEQVAEWPVVLIHLKYEKNREDIGLFGIWRD